MNPSVLFFREHAGSSWDPAKETREQRKPASKGNTDKLACWLASNDMQTSRGFRSNGRLTLMSTRPNGRTKCPPISSGSAFARIDPGKSFRPCTVLISDVMADVMADLMEILTRG